MKKQSVLWAVVIVLLAVFNVLAFVIPFVHTVVFWIVYVVTWAVFAAVAYAGAKTMGKPGLESKLLGWPIVRTAGTMLGIQLVLFFVLAAAAKVCPVQVAAVLEVLVAAVTVILLAVREVSRDVIVTSEQKVADRTGEWKKLRTAMTSLAVTGNADLKKLAEEMRYADPMPTTMDAEIGDVVEALKSDSGNAALISQLKDLLAQRKSAAKAGK